MMGYIIAISSYFLMAIANVIDKFLISDEDLKPKKYVFLIGFFSSLFLLLIPLGLFKGITLDGFLWGFSGGIARMFALWIFFILLEKGDISKVYTTIGGLIPLFSLLLTFIFFGFNLTPIFFLAFSFLILGTLVASFNRKGRISKKQIIMSVLTAFLFSSSFVFMKNSFLVTSFWSSIISLTFGTFIFSLLLFAFSKDLRKDVFQKKSLESNKKLGLLFLLGQFLGAGAGTLQNYSISLVSPKNISLVNALEGSKFVFIFIIAFFLSSKFPKIFNRKNAFQKIISIIIIVLGMYFVFKI
jgi:drug/metabolite transporter (DMT)-like permease